MRAIPNGSGRMDTTAEAQLLRRRAVEDLTGLGTSTLYKLVRAGRFPPARRVPGAPGVVVWLREEVESWIAALPESDPGDWPAPKRRSTS